MSGRLGIGRLGRQVVWSFGIAIAMTGCGGGTDASVVIDNVTLIDGTDRGAVPGMTIAINGDRIVAIGPTGKVKLGAVQTRIDGKGKFVIPGLWDMHAHLHVYEERALPLFLANGVTSIRELGGDLSKSGYVRQEVQAGRILGPEVYLAGPTIDAPIIAQLVPKGRYAVTTEESGKLAVDSLAKVPVDHLKVHSLIPRAAYFGVMKEAKEKHLLVAGHIPDSVSVVEAIEAGQRTIEHASKLEYPNSSRGKELEAAWVARTAKLIAAMKTPKLTPLFMLRLAMADSAARTYDLATATAFAKMVASKPVWIDPTLVVMRAVFRPNERDLMEPDELRYAPKAAIAYDEGIARDYDASDSVIAAGRFNWELRKQMLRELVRAKAKFLAGTDTPVFPLVPGFSLLDELGLLVEIGLTPLEAIQAATRNPAEAMEKPDRGVLEVGKVADLVLLRADPLADIKNVKSTESVLVRGHFLDRATLDRMLADAEAYAKQR